MSDSPTLDTVAFGYNAVIACTNSNTEIKYIFSVFSGQVPINPEVGDVVAEGIVDQTEQVMKNIGAILEVNGLTYTDVVKTTCFLADMGDFATFNEVYAKYFTGKPARSCVAVKTLPKNVLCEVEILAVTKK